MIYRIENSLMLLEQPGYCMPANHQTVLLASNSHPGKWYLPSQEEIAQKVFVAGRDESDTWCPPEKNLEYLSQFFKRVGLVESKGQGIIQAKMRLRQGLIVIALYQDLFPDLDHDQYLNDGDQGHYAFLTAIDLQRGLITIADPCRLIPGNERYFDESGVVLAQPYFNQAGYHPELKKVYPVRIHDFLPLWWDRRVPPQSGLYEQVFIWVDPTSRR